jgi:hypothetical protein
VIELRHSAALSASSAAYGVVKSCYLPPAGGPSGSTDWDRRLRNAVFGDPFRDVVKGCYLTVS